jgi:hypothetical protein
MTYALVIAATIAGIWLARFLWGILSYCGTPMMAVYFPVDDDFARSQAKMLESVGNAALGAGRAWTDRPRGAALRVVFVVNTDDRSYLPKLMPALLTVCLFYGPVVGLKPIGKLKFTITPWPLPDAPASETDGDIDEPDDKYEDEERDAA